MSAGVPTWPAIDHSRLPIPMAAFEVLAYLSVVALATLCFLAGWLTVNGAVVLTVLLLNTLIILSWVHLGQGRHPVFLFLCTLMFFQGGRLLAYCLGGEPEPMRVQLMQLHPFNISRGSEGVVLLCLTLSAICIYAPCRWKYEAFPPSSDAQVRRYLPYLYLLFFTTLPIQLFKNYRYFQYAQEHGGYASIFLSHASLAASVPFLVRAIPLITFPTFVAIFVFARRAKSVYFTTALYFGTASIILLMGSRGAIFGLILALWYAARVKSTTKTRLLTLLLLCLTLSLAADLVRNFRENPDDTSGYAFGPLDFLAIQGVSIDVTSTAVTYHRLFEPYRADYLWNEMQAAFVASDASNYVRGKLFAPDVSAFLSPILFSLGNGSGGSYIAEAYVIGGLLGVALVSLLIGSGLRLLHYLSRTLVGLFLVVMILPDVLLMPRGGLLDWASVVVKNTISIILLLAGWKIYTLVTSVRRSSDTYRTPMHLGSVG